MDDKKVKNITLEILDFVLSIPEAIVEGFDRSGLNKVFREAARERSLSVKKISRLFQNLKSRGYLEISKLTNGAESIRFTNKARLAVIDQLGDRIQVSSKYYLVSFDIPERLRTNRNRFRGVLKRLGCRQIQKSLWVSNRKIGEFVELAAEEYKVREYIVYAVVDSINITNEIGEMFEEGKE